MVLDVAQHVAGWRLRAGLTHVKTNAPVDHAAFVFRVLRDVEATNDIDPQVVLEAVERVEERLLEDRKREVLLGHRAAAGMSSGLCSAKRVLYVADLFWK